MHFRIEEDGGRLQSAPGGRGVAAGLLLRELLHDAAVANNLPWVHLEYCKL